jgi:rod shape-determining protein MreC
MVGETRAQAIAMGTGESLLSLEYLSGSASIQTGDAVVTSGIDGIYPEGFVVGRVEQIERAGGLFRSVRVRPAVDFSALEHVLVVTGAPDSAPSQPGGFVGPSPPGGRR